MSLEEEINNINEWDYLDFLKTVSDEDKEEVFNLIIKKVNLNEEQCFDFNRYIEVLPENLRLKFVELYDFEKWNAFSNITNGISDNTIAFKILKYALEKEKEENAYSILNIFKAVPTENKEQFLSLIKIKEQEFNKNIIDLYNIADYLNEFDYASRLHIVKNVIFKDFLINYDDIIMFIVPSVRFNSYNYPLILELFKGENISSLEQSSMFEMLKFLVSESKNIINKETNKPIGIVFPEKILRIFYEDGFDLREIIKYLIDSQTLDENMGLDEIVYELPDELKREYIEFIITYLENNERKLKESEFYRLIDSLSATDMEELFDKYVLKDKKFDYLYPLKTERVDCNYNCLDYLNLIFSRMSNEELKNAFNEIHTAFIENEKFPDYEDKYDLLVKVYSEKFNLNKDKLHKFIEKFGFTIVRYINNETLRKYINMDYESISKLFELFGDTNLYFDKSIQNDILNSLLQRQFMFKERDTYNIFSTFESHISNGNFDKVIELLKKIQTELDVNKILSKSQVSFEELIAQIKTGNLDLLHQITNQYIAYKREIYISENLPTSYNLLSLDKLISRESYKSYFLENEIFLIKTRCQELTGINYTNDQQHLLNDDNMLRELIMFKKDPKGYQLKAEYKKYLKVLNELLNILYDNKVDFDICNSNFSNNEDYNYDYVQKQISQDFSLGILIESNFDGMSKILENPILFDKLKQYLSKYKIIGWQDTFIKLLNECDIRFDEGTVAGLLSNFDKIVDKIENGSTLTSIIDYANCYSVVSLFYSLLLGREDFNLIAANPGRNKASMSKYDRIKGITDLIPYMFSREYVSIPTINQEFVLDNGKRIEVILGNSTNMINLTYGERTESCMRKGGPFNDLFDFCIKDKNGFHIRFSNPNTGKFVSRVSGIRNGNTVFLNELRNSLDQEFTNEDLYCALKMVAKYLVNSSKDSNMPIDNVIVTSDYALDQYNSENKSLNLTPAEKKDALRQLPFNFGDSGIILSSSNDEGTLVKYVFSDDVPNYNTVRDKIKTYYEVSGSNRMIQLHMINAVINGVPIEQIKSDILSEKPEYVISGEDFYIAYYKDKVDVFILDISKENVRTKIEIDSILNNKYFFTNSTPSKGSVRK